MKMEDLTKKAAMKVVDAKMKKGGKKFAPPMGKKAPC